MSAEIIAFPSQSAGASETLPNESRGGIIPDWIETPLTSTDLFRAAPREWYCRLKITGLKTRRIGPFRSRREALLRLDGILSEFMDTLADLESDPSTVIEDEFSIIAHTSQ